MNKNRISYIVVLLITNMSIPSLEASQSHIRTSKRDLAEALRNEKMQRNVSEIPCLLQGALRNEEARRSSLPSYQQALQDLSRDEYVKRDIEGSWIVHEVASDYIRPGSPADKHLVESIESLQNKKELLQDKNGTSCCIVAALHGAIEVTHSKPEQFILCIPKPRSQQGQ